MSLKPPPKRQNLYLGKAGQFVVMAECLYRGYNVAVPEVDIGDDLFVVNDASGDYRRIQVKTATAKLLRRAGGYRATFQIPLPQLQTAFTPGLIYIFAVRLPEAWGPFLVIQQGTLDALRELHGIGSVYQQKLSLTISYSEAGDAAWCGSIWLTPYLNRFTNLPETVADPLA